MKKFWQKLLSDDENGVSFGHVICLLVTVYLMVAVGATLVQTQAHTIPDIPQGWVYVLGIFWGSQKARDAVVGLRKSDTPTTKEP